MSDDLTAWWRVAIMFFFNGINCNIDFPFCWVCLLNGVLANCKPIILFQLFNSSLRQSPTTSNWLTIGQFTLGSRFEVQQVVSHSFLNMPYTVQLFHSYVIINVFNWMCSPSLTIHLYLRLWRSMDLPHRTTAPSASMAGELPVKLMSHSFNLCWTNVFSPGETFYLTIFGTQTSISDRQHLW